MKLNLPLLALAAGAFGMVSVVFFMGIEKKSGQILHTLHDCPIFSYTVHLPEEPIHDIQCPHSC